LSNLLQERSEVVIGSGLGSISPVGRILVVDDEPELRSVLV